MLFAPPARGTSARFFGEAGLAPHGHSCCLMAVRCLSGKARSITKIEDTTLVSVSFKVVVLEGFWT
jgi:hypothetical protein